MWVEQLKKLSNLVNDAQYSDRPFKFHIIYENEIITIGFVANV